jgi:adenosylhomocysteine nucleosidase
MIGIVAALPAEARCLSGAEGRVVVSGVGAAAAARACATLVAGGVEALVSWGTAAGLTDAMTAGCVVIDASASADLWADGLVARLDGLAVRGTIACPATVLQTPADKRALAAATGALVADMETDAVAAAARAAGVPWLAVRAVADAVGVRVPASVLRAIDDRGRVRYGRLGAALLGRPRDVAALPAMARGFNAALGSLRVVALSLDGMAVA